MFANTFQSGFISVFYSVGSNPLQLWDKQVKNGHIRRVVDDEVRSLVLEISGTNVATTYITCPIKPRLSLGIRLPFLVMIIKNMKKYFTFEIQILDDKDMHRRFRVSNFQSTTKVRPFCTTMPIGLSSGWNQVQFNLADFTKRAYGSTYLETTRVQIHANVRIRRIYFSDVLYSDDELPNEYKLFLPTPGTQAIQKPTKPAADKKESISKETGESKKLSAGDVPMPTAQEPTPSAAPPSPAGPESPENIAVEEIPAPSEPPSDAVAESEIVEPPSEKTEETETAEPTTEATTEVTDEAPTDTASELPAEEGAPGEVFTEASEVPTEAPAETEKPAELEASPPESAANEVPPTEEPAPSVTEEPPAAAEEPSEEAAAEAT